METNFEKIEFWTLTESGIEVMHENEMKKIYGGGYLIVFINGEKHLIYSSN